MQQTFSYNSFPECFALREFLFPFPEKILAKKYSKSLQDKGVNNWTFYTNLKEGLDSTYFLKSPQWQGHNFVNFLKNYYCLWRIKAFCLGDS